ncbi:hypothetical protein TNCV_2586331 [Trichonephila clavipes]|nr:hypothetical protein TNCV_2586331 [Trichonephila clavipes]
MCSIGDRSGDLAGQGNMPKLCREGCVTNAMFNILKDNGTVEATQQDTDRKFFGSQGTRLRVLTLEQS